MYVTSTAPSLVLRIAQLSPQPAHAAATAAVAKRYKPDQIPMLFGVYFTKFMAAVSDRTASSTQTWGVTRDLVVAELFTGRLPSDPIRAAAYTAAALLVEVIPPDNGASPGVTTTSRGPSVHATTATTLQGTTVTCPTATAGRDDIDNVRAPNTLGARQAAIVSSLGQSPTIARTVSNSYEQKTQDIDQQQLGSMNSTAGYAAATACPRSGEYPGGTSNETASSTATMPRPIVTVLARTPWPTQQYRCRDPVDTLGTGSSVPSCDMSDRVSSAAMPGGEKPIRSSGVVSAMSGASSNAPPPTKAAVATAAASGADLNACVPPEPPPSRKMSVDASAPLVAQAAAGAVVAKEVTTTAAAAAADVTSSPVVAGAEVGGAGATAAVVLPAAAVGAATGPANEQLFLGAFDQDIDAHVSLGQTFYRVEPSVSVAPGATAMTAPAAEAIDTSGATKESTLAAAAVCATPLSTTVEVEATEATSAAGFPPTPNLLEAWDTAAGLPGSPTTNPAEDFYCSVVGNGGSSPCSKKRKATCSECEGESDPCDCGSRKKVRKQ